MTIFCPNMVKLHSLQVMVYPKKSLYFKSMSNWIDIISVMPFYCRIVANGYLDQVTMNLYRPINMMVTLNLGRVQELEFIMRKMQNLFQVHSSTNKKLIQSKSLPLNFHSVEKSRGHKLQNQL